MPLTPNNYIFYADTDTALDPAAISAAEATSIENAFNLRSRYSFSWANQAQRDNQLGMTAGSTGYQVDTKTEYIYESGWRLKMPYAEFTTTKSSQPNSSVLNVGVFTIDPAFSTSSTFATPGTDGIIFITDPGIYAISSLTAMTIAGLGNPSTGRTFLDLTRVSTAADVQRMSISVGEDRGSLSKPNMRITAPNTPLYFQIFRTVANTADTISTRVSIARIG